MTDKLTAALRANQALIESAQAEIGRYLSKQIEQAELVDRLIRIFDGPEQREAQVLAKDAGV